MRILLAAFCAFSLSFSFAQKKLVDYVNPFIGTQKMGHTYPGATVPFGAVQLSPDTDTIPMLDNGKYNPDVYKYCAGYNYDDKTIVGFSHTHFSGTGHSDLGDLLMMPTLGKLQLNPGTANNPENGYRSRFSHSTEIATPGYYKVLLDDDSIVAEMTTAKNTGIHRYTFLKGGDGHIVIDLAHNIYNYKGKNVWTYLKVEDEFTISGWRQTNGWARTRTVYFTIKFNKPIASYGVQSLENLAYNGFWRRFNLKDNFPEAAGKDLRMHVDFPIKAGEQLIVKVGLSAVSIAGAKENMKADNILNEDFDTIKQNASNLWEKELSVINANFLNDGDKTNFYTSLYHTMLAPTSYQDASGFYKGINQEIYQSSTDNYTTFSLWDTYRALHPLFTLIQPARNANMINSMLAHQQQSPEKMLPIWSHFGNENWCMSGYHSVSVICDAIVKGLSGFDYSAALDACITTANRDFYDGLGDYKKLGYVPADRNGISVSNTLEYAYNDWCIAQAAKKLGRQNVYEEFMRRSQSWKNVFDNSIGFMRPKMKDGSFKKEFDVLSTHDQGFIEGNAWNYSFFVPQDVEGLVNAMGGEKVFTNKLDTLFTMHLPDQLFAETEDITREGIIGGYVHGNEPAHHVPYLYNYTNKPYKTQALIRKILPMQYKPTPDGLGGNDDCGQMSAWYAFSALGFYPIAPGSDRYYFGSPLIKNAVIHFTQGKTLTIKANNQSDKNIYVKKILLNGKPLSRRYILHEELIAGGVLEYFMAAKP